jgi:non-heme chloroperoxidase
LSSSKVAWSRSGSSRSKSNGEELSSVGSRHPEKIAGLVYLDAAYGYAFYNPAHGGLDLDALEVRKKIEDLATEDGSDKRKAISDILAELPSLEKKLQTQEKEMVDLATNPPDSAGQDDEFGPEKAILLGQKKYREIKVPVLAIYADPHDLGKLPPEFGAAWRAAMVKYDVDYTATYSNAFEAGVPSAHVVRIPNALIFQSNEAQVLKEMDVFIGNLPN